MLIISRKTPQKRRVYQQLGWCSFTCLLTLDTRKDDCFIELNLNGKLFIILAESYRDNRQFGQRSYTITGRSHTAKLGADYAVSHKGLVNQDRNARQIADEVIAMLGVELDWQIDD